MNTVTKRFSINDNLVQIPLEELKSLLEPNLFRVLVKANEVEVVDEDEEVPLTEAEIAKVEAARRIPLSQCTQIVK